MRAPSYRRRSTPIALCAAALIIGAQLTAGGTGSAPGRPGGAAVDLMSHLKPEPTQRPVPEVTPTALATASHEVHGGIGPMALMEAE